MISLQQLHEEGDREFEEKFVGGFDAIPEESPYINQIKNFLHQEREKAYKAGIDMAIEIANRNIELENWSHTVGSHSDDRGGDSDIECACRDQEQKHRREAYKCLITNLKALKGEE